MSEELQGTDLLPERRARRSPLRRVGCLVAIVLWFLVLLAPCGLFYLATQGEIALTLSQSPPQTLRVWLVMEAGQRGIGFSHPSIVANVANQTVCVQTDVTFLLWEGQADDLASTYCDCYAQGSGLWTLTNTGTGLCQP
ncbi:MAG: hypothetical protein H6672_09710 [Anaerolineaceae bacterium]|nr:hypothetical protein [Anaerolineaceae bacterium]